VNEIHINWLLSDGIFMALAVNIYYQRIREEKGGGCN